MKDLDLQEIWRGNPDEMTNVPSLEEAAQQKARQSVNLVERIRQTARSEHRIFLILAAVSTVLLLIFGWYYPALAMVVFTILIIWKYRVEMRLFNRIQPENSTLEYLQAVRDLLERFMRNYRIGILILVPLASISGILVGHLLAIGRIDWSILQRPSIWVSLVVSIGLGILFSRLWLNFWVNTLYGRKLKEMQGMIDELML